jgi:hypothetical protein
MVRARNEALETEETLKGMIIENIFWISKTRSA